MVRRRGLWRDADRSQRCIRVRFTVPGGGLRRSPPIVANSRLDRDHLLGNDPGLWIEHLTGMDEMRQGIGLQAYGQRDPLIAYKTEGFRMFQSLLTNIRHDLTHQIYWVEVVRPLRPRAMEEAVTNREEDGETKKRPKKRGAQKVGRNDPCPCGSGKKYKKCCMRD